MKKILSLILCIVMVVALLPTATADASLSVTWATNADEAATMLEYLIGKYKGKYWNYYDRSNNKDSDIDGWLRDSVDQGLIYKDNVTDAELGVTTTACSKSEGCRSNAFRGADGYISSQCKGFAWFMAYAMFHTTDKSAYTEVSGDDILDLTLQPGDIIQERSNNGYSNHTAVIVSINGDKYTTLQCSGTNYCEVKYVNGIWSKPITNKGNTVNDLKQAIKESGGYIYRVDYEKVKELKESSTGNSTSETTSDYIRDNCTKYNTRLTVKLTKDENIYTLPCSTGTCSDSQITRSAFKGESFTATALYKNSAGNYWYQLNGDDTYIYAGSVTVTQILYDDIKISNLTAPANVKSGERFQIKGTISSDSNYLKTAHSYIRSGGSDVQSTSYNINGRSCDIKTTALNKDLWFKKLSKGDYSLVFTVEVDSAYSSDGKTLSYYNGTPELLNINFTLSSSANKTADISASQAQNVDVTSGSSASSNARTIADGTYNISTALDTNYLMDVKKYSESNYSGLMVWKSNGKDEQKFYIKYEGNGLYSIKSISTGLYLTAAGNAYGTSYSVGVSSGGTNDTQLWRIESAGDGSYFIILNCADTYLDVSNAYAANGTEVKTFKRNGGYMAQNWYFTEAAATATAAPTSTPTPTPKATTQPATTTTAPSTGSSGDYISSKCTKYDTRLTVKLSKDENIYTLPCSTGTCSDSQITRSASKGESFTATALYKNSAGNYWYQLNGDDTYIYAGSVTVTQILYDDIKISNLTAPANVKSGERFQIKGTISADSNYLKTAYSYIRSGGSDVQSTSYDVNGRSCDIYSTALNKNLWFRTLSKGSYSLVITVAVDSAYSSDGKTLSYYSGTPELLNINFTLSSSETKESDISSSQAQNVDVTASEQTSGDGIYYAGQTIEHAVMYSTSATIESATAYGYLPDGLKLTRDANNIYLSGSTESTGKFSCKIYLTLSANSETTEDKIEINIEIRSLT